VTIGLSLPLGYLTGADDSAGDKCLSGSFGKPRDCLADLKDNGITSIELQGFGPDASPDKFRDAVERILGSGMQLTLHGYLSDNTGGRLSGDIHSQLLSTVESFENRQEETVVVVHVLASPGASYRTVVETTTQALARLAEDIRTHNLPVTIGLEINRYHGADSPGTTYDGLLDIVQRLGSSEIGFCWDMGHTSSSVLQKKLALVPPPEFIAKVIHTHVHDLSPEGDTHWPLTESCPHLASGISRLEACGYTGIYNLELYPTRWGAQQDAKDGILRSVLRLSNIIRSSRGHIS
jgi:sugar phosphate isomerase/epimerase